MEPARTERFRFSREFMRAQMQRVQDPRSPDLQTALPVGTAVPVSGGDFTVSVRTVSAAGAAVTLAGGPALC